MKNQLLTLNKYLHSGTRIRPIAIKLCLLFGVVLFVNIDSFGQKKKERYDMYPDLKKILDEPLSDSSCDVIKLAYLDFKLLYIDHLKKEDKGFRKSKEKQDRESAIWDKMIEETDTACRREIVVKWTVRNFCGRIRAKQTFSPC